MYAGTEPSNLYRSDDGGRSWERLPALLDVPSVPRWSFPPRPWTHHVSTIAPHPTDPARLAVGIELGGVIRSLDGGASWIDHNPSAHSDAHDLRTHPLAPDRLYEAAGQGIARSDDGRRDLGASRAEPRPPLRVGAGDRPGGPRPLVRLDQPFARTPPTARVTGTPDCCARAATAGARSIPGGRRRGCGGCRTRSPRCTDQAGRLLVGLRGGALLVSDDAGESWAQLGLELPDVIALAAAPL